MTVMPRCGAAIVAALIVILLLAVPVAAHAEFVSSDPAPDAEVDGPFPGPIELTFDEPLRQGSQAELLGPDGSKVAEAAIPGDAPEQLIFELGEPLGPGAYEVRWTSIGQDREVDRGTFEVTVLEPEPTPSPTATPLATDAEGPSPSPDATPSPSPSPSPGSNGHPQGPAASSGDVVLPIVAALIILAVLGAVLLRNRRNRAA